MAYVGQQPKASQIASSWSVGDVKHTVRNTADSGWALCFGQTVDASIGTIYVDLWTYLNANSLVGAGKPFTGTQGALVFPDLRGMGLVGVDTMGGVARNKITALNAVGATTGEATHVLTVAELASHAHIQQQAPTGTTRNGSSPFTAWDSGAGPGTNGMPTTSIGSDTAHNNVQPSIAVNIQVKL